MKKKYTYLFFYLIIFSYLSAQEISSSLSTIIPDITIMIPMRDGTQLPTDLYLPFPDAKGLPCILLRSPAGRQAQWKTFAQLAKAGYVIAIQDTRNVLDKEGKTFPFISDGWGKMQDGYDTVEWLASSEYTNGKIGTWGSSALGITQLLMAPSQPPHLKCQYIIVAAASLYHHGLFPGGQLLKHQAESWLGHYAHDTGVLNYISQRPFYNEFWKQLNTIEVANRIQVPAIHVGGWYDTFLQGTLDAFTSRQYQGSQGALGNQKLVIGPWTHFWPLSTHFGDFTLPPVGEKPPFDISPKLWFDFYLKGIDDHIDQLPTVIYYVMGPFDGSSSSGNIWRTANEWPVPAISTSFYLNENQELQKNQTGEEKSFPFLYDPSHPIPTLGGRNLFLESGPKDQQSIEKRKDIVLFTTPTLTEDVEVTGPLSAVIFITSDQKDTDIVLRLTDVYPDGKSVLISEGISRVGLLAYESEKRYHLNNSIPIPVSIDLWATSIVFAKGHAIRLSVSSSNFPRYEKNLNIGLLANNKLPWKTAKNTIWIGKQFPSRIILPLVKKNDIDNVSASL